MITQGTKAVVTQTEVSKPQSQSKPIAATTAAAHSIVPVSGGDNIVILSNASSNAASGLQFIQQKPQTTTASQYATVNMAQYVTDGTTLLMPTQATLPLGQQLVYWAAAPGQVVQSSQAAILTGTGAQASILQQPSSQTAATLVQGSSIQFIKPQTKSSEAAKKIIHLE